MEDRRVSISVLISKRPDDLLLPEEKSFRKAWSSKFTGFAGLYFFQTLSYLGRVA